MHDFFKKKNSMACIATRKFKQEETGFAVVDNGIIKEFLEKPNVKLSNSECLGVYILNTKILEQIRKKSKSKKDLNLSYHILQDLTKKKLVSAFDIGKNPWIDAESPVIIERNKKMVNNIIRQMKS